MKQNSYSNAPKTSDATSKKTRRCLSCGNPFESEWVGNRVCKKCKDTTAWKSGNL